MDNVHDLINNLKQLSVKANNAEEPMSINYAEVVTVNPLKIDFGDYKVDESDELLVLTRRIKQLQKGKIKLKLDSEQEYELVDDKLKKGDCVVCLQEPGGEGWVVLDAVEVDDE